MKKSVLSLVTILALSGVVYAGGDVAPIEEVVETPVVVDESAFYIGAGVGYTSFNNDFTSEEITSNTLMLQAGYQYNRYIAVEGRYSFGFNTDYDTGNIVNPIQVYDGDVSHWGIYLKPMYPIDDFSIYALLGYGEVMLDDILNGDAVDGGFQWGLGASYAFTENVSVFVDYVSLYNDTGFDWVATKADIDVDTWTLGVSYKF
jgi:opacity protein-like surface antigen